MDPPPPPATNQIHSYIPHSYAESVESSPRSRTTETWDDRESLSVAAPGGGKLRLMCSYGGHIIPKPHDKSLSYVGGDTRMVVVDRNISLSELQTRLSRNLLQNQLFTLKYQLPNEDLDSLISVTSDEDLENMIDEFDRICANSSVAKSSRLRVFLFMNTRESASSIDWILDGSVKSEDWFFNTLNGSKSTALGYSDTKSVNSLLGFESAFKNGVNQGQVETDLSRNQKSNSNQNAQINAESVVFDASSSFGSTTSSVANLPPIRVRVEGSGGGMNGGNKVQDQRVAGVEEQFAQMGVSAGGRQTEASATMVSPPPPLPTNLIPAAAAVVNPGRELNEQIVEDDERSDQGVPVGNFVLNQTQPQLQTQSQRQQKPNAMFDLASPKSASSEGGMLYQEQVGHNNARAQGQQKAFEAGYVMHSQFEQQQLQQQLQQMQQQQQQHQQQNQQHQQQRQQNQQHHQNQQQHQQNQQQQHQQNQQQQQHQQHQQHQQQQEHLKQQQQQQQEHLQQQQQQQHQQQQQQQHQQQQQNHQQQFVHPGTHYNQQSHNAVPMSQYYQLYPPPTQRHQPQLDQQQYPFYFMPPTSTRQPQQAYNMSMRQATYSESSNADPSSFPSAYSNQSRNVAPDNHEIASSDYRNAQSMDQLAPGQLQQQQYMTYSQVNHAPQTITQLQNPSSATNSSYVFEYADPAHSQIYSTQPLAHPASYQTMVSSSQMAMSSDASSAQNPSDNMNYQNTTQAQRHSEQI